MDVSLEKMFKILLKQAIDIDKKAEIKSMIKSNRVGHQGIYVRVQ